MDTPRQSPTSSATVATTTASPPVQDHVTTTAGTPPDVATDWQDQITSAMLTAMTGAAHLLGHLLEYLLTPGVILTHVVVWALLYSLTRHGTEYRAVLRAAIVQEVVTYILWCTVPISLGTILAVYLGVYLYESLYGPKVVVRDNAQLLTEDDVRDTIQEAAPDLRYDSIQDGTGFRICTNLQYIIHTPTQWSGADNVQYAAGVWLSQISSVHSGYDHSISRTLRTMGADSRSCLYVTLSDDTTTVTYVARDRKSRDQWLGALQQLCCSTVGNVVALWLQQASKQAGIDQVVGPLQLDTVARLLTAAGRLTDRCYLAELIKVSSTSPATNTRKGHVFKSKTGSSELQVDAQQLEQLFDAATFRPEIQIVYEKVLLEHNNSKVLDTSTFCKFLSKVQQENDIDLQTSRALISQYETVLSSSKLSIVGFTSYLLSPHNSIFSHVYRDTVYQDMDQPLSHYFISTSHNTYVTKDQLQSKSSVEMYSIALKRGCRCVELDTWDGPNNEPVIYHGRTLTSKILLKDVITAIKEHGFVASQYPVILSFENHCSVEQQQVIASHLINILGDMLYQKPIAEDEKQYPSPNDLKGYVLVKYKKLKAGQDLAYDEDSSDDDDDDDDDDENGAEDDDDRDGQMKRAGSVQSITGMMKGIKGKKKNKKNEEGVVESSEDEDDDVSIQPEEEDERGEEEKKKGSVKSIMGVMKGLKGKKSDKKKDDIPKIAKEFSDLVIYCQSVKFKGFDYVKEKGQYYEMSSIGEKKVLKLTKDECLSFLDYTSRQICRTYPAGNRIISSNYDPHSFWNIGTQMVALNFQTKDRPMQLYQGQFLDNGGCGYILKPEYTRIVDTGFNPRGPFDTCRLLTIQVISGHQLPYNNEKHVRSERGLSVLVRLSGVDADAAKDKTKTVKNNGYHVIWNETLKFRVHVPELALLQFTVREGSDTFLAQYTLPVRCIQQGYRNVPLWTKGSVPIANSALFVLVNIADPQPTQ